MLPRGDLVPKKAEEKCQWAKCLLCSAGKCVLQTQDYSTGKRCVCKTPEMIRVSYNTLSREKRRLHHLWFQSSRSVCHSPVQKVPSLSTDLLEIYTKKYERVSEELGKTFLVYPSRLLILHICCHASTQKNTQAHHLVPQKTVLCILHQSLVKQKKYNVNLVDSLLQLWGTRSLVLLSRDFQPDRVKPTIKKCTKRCV